MDSLTFQVDWFATIAIPLMIMCMKIIEVSMGTLRIMFVSKGIKYIAPIVGFFEILLWLTAVTQVFQNLTNVANYIAYALGFSIGNYIGIMIEEKISLGTTLVRVITRRDATDLTNHLISSGYHVTHIDAQGEEGPVKVLFTVVKRRQLTEVVGEIKRFNPRAFYTIEDMRFVSDKGLMIKPASHTAQKDRLFRKRK